MKTLFVRPCHDDVVAYLHHYSKSLVKESRKRAVSTIDKEKKQANKDIVTEIIIKKYPSFIMFNGHGSPDAIAGHNDEIIISSDKNSDILKNRITYALSCSSAAGLGKRVADKHTTFIGYTDEFALGMDVNCQSSIQKDKRAKLFLEPSNTLVRALLKGNSAEEAVIKAKRVMKENISNLKTDSAPDAKDYIPFLFNNYLILDIKGNAQASLK